MLRTAGWDTRLASHSRHIDLQSNSPCGGGDLLQKRGGVLAHRAHRPRPAKKGSTSAMGPWKQTCLHRSPQALGRCVPCSYGTMCSGCEIQAYDCTGLLSWSAEC